MVEYSSALVGYAVLRANYNSEAPSYVDNFRGFVLGVLAEHQEPVTRDVIAFEIRDSFGIAIPDLVVGKIIKRAKLTHLVDENRIGFFLTKQGHKVAPAVRGMRDKYLRQQRGLEDRFRAFIAHDFPEQKTLLEADVAGELGKYLERHSVPLIANSVKGRAFAPLPLEDAAPGFEYVIARFVANMSERDDVGFGYLEEAAKGAILAAVVTLDTSSFHNSLDALAVYVDTPVLIDLLGFSGSAPMLANHQLLELAQKQGASVLVFEHSLRELDGVLQSAENFSRSAQNREARPMNLHFQEQGWTAADITLARQAVPEALAVLQIGVIAKPEDYRRFGLDEEKLEQALQDAVHYKHESSRRYDVESLSAIHRLRKGNSRGTLDRCGAVLLTNNVELVRATIDDERHEWPLAMTDSALAGILWARSPAVAGELPRNMVLAAAYAGMQPDPRLWTRYVDEVTVLENRGAVSADDAVVLRSTSQGRNALMDETLGIESRLSSESPVDVLARIKDELEQPVLEQLRAHRDSESVAKDAADTAAGAWIEKDQIENRLTRELEVAKAASEALSTELERQRATNLSVIQTIDGGAAKTARNAVRLILWTIAGPLVVFSAVSLAGPSWIKDLPDPVRWALGGATVIVAALAVLDSLGQGNVKEWLAPLEGWLARSLARRRRRLAGISEIGFVTDVSSPVDGGGVEVAGTSR
jgi:hypothetical protein